MELTGDERALFDMQIGTHSAAESSDDVTSALLELEGLKSAPMSDTVRAALWYGWSRGRFDCAVRNGKLVFAHRHHDT